MAKKKNGKNKGKIGRERAKVMESIRAQERMEREKQARINSRIMERIEQAGERE